MTIYNAGGDNNYLIFCLYLSIHDVGILGKEK